MKQMPSQSPTRAATSGCAGVEVKSRSRGIGGASHRQLLDQDDEPAAVVVVHRVDRAVPGRVRRRRRPRAEHRPRERRPSCGLPHSSRTLPRLAAACRAGRGRRRPGRRGRAAPRPGAAARTGSPPMPMLPSASSAHTQAALTGQLRRTRRGAGRSRRAPGSRDRLRDDVDTEHADAPRGEVAAHPARAAADVEGRARRSGRAPPRRWRPARRSTATSATGAAGPRARAPCTARRRGRPRSAGRRSLAGYRHSSRRTSPSCESR